MFITEYTIENTLNPNVRDIEIRIFLLCSFLFYFINSTCIPRPYLAISSDLNRIKKKQNNILKRMGDLKIRGHL